MFIYLFWDRKTEHKQGRGRQRVREFQAGSMLSPLSPMRGSNSWIVRPWPELKSRVRRSSDWGTQAPRGKTFLVTCWVLVQSQALGHLNEAATVKSVIKQIPPSHFRPNDLPHHLKMNDILKRWSPHVHSVPLRIRNPEDIPCMCQDGNEWEGQYTGDLQTPVSCNTRKSQRGRRKVE